MKRTNRPSMKDIADHVGVSITTVSAVINPRSNSSIRVGEETRQRVLRGLQELGYSPNAAAQVLAGGRTRILAVFTYEPVFPFEHHSFYYPFLLGMEQEAERQHYDLLFMTSCTNQDGRRTIYQGGVNRLRLTDGAILLGLSKNEAEITRVLSEGFPVVMIGHREFPGYAASYVAADYAAATAQIVARIAGRGHRKIVMLRVLEDSEPGSDRENGFHAGCVHAGIPETSRRVIRTSPERINRAFVDSILEEGFTAVVCERFAIAEAVRTVLSNQGRSIPDDLSVAALGGPRPDGALPHATAEPVAQPWTTLQVPSQEMGVEAVRLVLELLEHPERSPVRTTLACPIFEGATVGDVPSEA